MEFHAFANPKAMTTATASPSAWDWDNFKAYKTLSVTVIEDEERKKPEPEHPL
jgi:hypothetical protein